MELLTPSQMQQVDEKAIKTLQIPGLLLMEHAAHQVFSYLKAHFEGKKICVVCGPGNNGGDGLAIARQLMMWSTCPVKIIMVAPYHKLTEDGKTYFTICKNLGANLLEVTEDNENEIIDQIDDAEVIVDALFGTGLTRPVQGQYKKIIEHINAANSKVISVDIPSGIDGLTGQIQGICVKADWTITFVRPKLGLYLYPAIEYTGEVRVVKIGIPDKLVKDIEVRAFSIEKQEMKALLPIRPIRSNKGSFGKVLTIGGSLGMAGAISLTSMAAYKVGCGTVTSIVPRCILEIMQQKLTEVMAIGLKDTDGHFGKEAAYELKTLLPNYHIVAIGPGIGRSKAVLSMLIEVLESDKPCIIDADALYFIPEVLELLKVRIAPTIITPHPGEMARLVGANIEEILKNPLKYVEEFAKKFNTITVLKLEKTVIADRTGIIYINRYGNSGLAKGGSGDTLTGIITGLLAQHLTPIDAAKLGVYLQTRSADLAKDVLSEYSLMPSDVICFLSKAFLELT